MKPTIVSIIIASALIIGALIISGGGKNGNSQPANNVSVVDGKQVIEINVQGGYSPRLSTAQAGIPTVLRMKTDGTFDCSRALSIPTIGYRQVLPQSGVTEIQVPAQQSGAILQGTCSMGMYNFAVKFN